MKYRVLVSMLKYPPDYTGAGFRIHKMYTRMIERSAVEHVDVITSSEHALDDSCAVLDGIEVHYTGHNKYMNDAAGCFNVIKKMVLVLIGSLHAIITYMTVYRQTDLVHTIDSSWLSTIIGWCAFITRKPLIKEIVCMNIDDPWHIRKTKPPIIRNYFLLPFHHAKMIIAISKPLQDICIRSGIDPGKIWCRYNPVYLRPEDETAPDEINAYGIILSRPTLLWIGIIERRKNLEFLVKSSRYIEGEVNILFAGPCNNDEYLLELSSLIKEIHAETYGKARVFILNRMFSSQELAYLYNKAALFWFSSHSEGLGNVLIESLLCGTPVVTLPLGGIAASILTDDDGKIVDTDDPRVFAKVVNDCIYNREFNRKKIASRAKKRFDPETIESDYLFHFMKIMNSRA